MLMKFGKFKGSDISEIPDSYLQWLSSNVQLREPLASVIWEELQERGLEPEPMPTAKRLDADKVRTVYRMLSQKWHPDHGGDTEAMKAINEFYSMLTGRG